MESRAIKIATKIYNYYYSLAIKEFRHDIAHTFAKIPADYIYNELLNNTYYINDKCYLKYCIDLLDSEFNVLDDTTKRFVYENALGVFSGNISKGEINTRLKRERKQFQNLYNNSVKKYKLQLENNFNKSFGNMGIQENSEDLFSNLRLN